MTPDLPRRRRLGRGRSGEVWLVEQGGGRHVEKVFFGDTLSNLVHYVFSGAPNPYIWNEDAVRAACLRRRILSVLVPWWFDGRLGLADAVGVGWNRRARVFTLAAEFVDGAPLPLPTPFRPPGPDYPALSRELMPRLQRHLQESGFVGLVWQAGKGNPVALNNYLCAGGRFVFIDAESGVPALFPLNPLALLGFYLPQALRRGRPLFDDVDVLRLRGYLRRHAAALAPRMPELLEHVAALEEHQRRWHGLRRRERAIAYQLAKGRLSPDEAGHYRRHGLAWHRREAGRFAVKLGRAVAVKLPRALGRLLRRVRPAVLWRRMRLFVTSQAYRTKLGEDYIRNRVARWRRRGQIAPAEARQLLDELAALRESSRYVTDFGAHLGMKASFLVLELVVLGGLSLLGVPLLLLGLLFAIDGPIYRSLYTGWRSVQAIAERSPPPWVAFLVGLVPLFGSLAFPAQMLWSAGGRRETVARFIVYDTFSRIGTRLPIWGGPDTATEHVMVRAAARLVGDAPGAEAERAAE